MARIYGWTPREIDDIDKNRIEKWWFIEDVFRLASEHYEKTQSAFQQAMDSLSQVERTDNDDNDG